MQHGFLLSEGNFTQIDPPTGTFTELIAINDNRVIVGHTDISGYDIPFEVEDGVFTNINIAGAKYGGTTVGGIDNDGDLVGSYYATDGTAHGFLFQSGVVTNIDIPIEGVATYPAAINNVGTIVGVFTTPYNSYGFEYVNGVFSPFTLNGEVSFIGVDGVNDLGQIVGDYHEFPEGKGRPHGYLAKLPVFEDP